MKVNFKSFLFSSAIAITFSACYYDNIEDLHPAPVIIPGVNDTTTNGCDTSKAITYTADIKEIFQTNCPGCHTGSGASGGIDLSTYAGAKGAATLLIDAVTWADGINNMPQTAKINDCSIGKIKKWVESGTPE